MYVGTCIQKFLNKIILERLFCLQLCGIDELFIDKLHRYIHLLLLYSAMTPRILLLFIELCLALIDAANDKQQEVRQMIMTSLHELGKKQPEMVLSAIKGYLIKHQKVFIMIMILKLNDIVYASQSLIKLAGNIELSSPQRRQIWACLKLCI